MNDPTSPEHPSSLSRWTPTRIVLGVAAAVVVVGALGAWWFLRDDAPPEVSLDRAVESVETTEADADTSESATGSTTADAAAGIDGTWTVDTETGDFDHESATGSFVGFRISEELSTIGSTTAVGRTGDIEGTMVIDGTAVTETAVEIDLTTITTETSRRDDNVQDALETDEFPTATFTLTDPIELGEGAEQGEAVSVTAGGELQLHGVTQPIEFDLEARLVDGTVVAVGSTTIAFSDYDIDVPDGGPVISVDDEATLELQLLLTR